MNQRIQLASIDDQRNAAAREAVRRRISWPVNLTPANVTYHSRGHAVLIGAVQPVTAAARALQHQGLASLTLLTLNDAAELPVGSEPVIEQPLSAEQLAQLTITGHLGAFHLQVPFSQGETLDLAQVLVERDAFDVVLDLTAPGMLPAMPWNCRRLAICDSLPRLPMSSASKCWRVLSSW